MTALCDVIIFLSIALLAIVVTVFVLAASLLGRALERAKEEQRKIEEKQLAEQDASISRAEEELRKAKETRDTAVLEEQLREFRKAKRAREKEARRAMERYQLLTVRGSIVYPVLFFVSALTLVTAAKLLESGLGAYVLCAGSVVALFGGCRRLYQCLMVVQDVAITSEEAQLKRTVEAFELALEAHEAKARPKLALEFLGKGPPLTFAAATENAIEVAVHLAEGEVARGARLAFFAPQDFEFPGQKTTRQPADFRPLPKAVAAHLNLPNVIAGSKYLRSVTIKTPPHPGDFEFKYRLICERFVGSYESFMVKVE